MCRAKSAIEQSIPNAGKEISPLLNSVSDKQIFESQNSVSDLITILTIRADEIDTAFGLVPVNENIMGCDAGKTFTKKNILDYQRFWLNDHCYTINTTFTLVRITSENLKNKYVRQQLGFRCVCRTFLF